MKIEKVNAERGETPHCFMRLTKLYLSSRQTKKDHDDPGKCQRWAFYFVDGKPFCKQHAGEMAISHIQKENRGVRIIE